MHHKTMRFEIELDAIERRPELRDRDAIELLRDELRLALNASHFIALSADDPSFHVSSRSFPQEGIARYALTISFSPRRPLGERDAMELVYSELQRALNASYFLRIFAEDPSIEIFSRELAAGSRQLRDAA